MVKILTSTDDAWRARFVHEIAVYRALADRQAPVRTPELLHTDGERVLVLERLPGGPLGTDRYPAAVDLEPALRAITAFRGWTPMPGVLGPAFDYAGRIDRHHRLGIVDDASRAALQRLLTGLGQPDTPTHGDPLPSNLIVDGGECGLIDFEYTGLFLPGYDLAMLHTVLVRITGAQERVRALVTDADAFLVNRAVVLARELNIHRGRDRLALIEPQWTALVRELARRQPG